MRSLSQAGSVSSWRRLSPGFLAAAGLIIPWLLVSIERYGIQYQLAFAVTMIVVPLAAIGIMSRPHFVLCGYAFVLPLLPDTAEAGPVNAGQLLTFLILALAAPGLLLTWRPIPRELRRIVWPFLALAGLGAASVVSNSVTAPEDVANAVLKYAVFGLVAVVAYMHIDTEEKTAAMLRALLLAAVLVAVYSAFAFFTGRSYYPEYGFSRASGTFEHWNQLGGYMALSIFPMFAFGMSRRGTFVWLTCLAGVGLLITAMLLSLTIGSILGFVGALAVGVLVFFRKSIGRATSFIIAALAVAAVTFQLVPAIAQRLDIADARVEDRFGTFRLGIHLISEHPLLGLGSQAQVLEAVLATSAPGLPSISVVPHNIFLGIGAEKGIFGMVLLALLIFNVVRLVLFDQRSLQGTYRAWHIGIALGTVAMLIQSMSNLLLLHARIGIVWMIMLAIAVRLRQFATQNTYQDPVL